jgi:hypothetical protein
MYRPPTWSEEVNGDVYTYVALVLQAAQALNITVPEGKKYNVPSGNFTFGYTGNTSSLASLTSYTEVAISGADDFSDDGVTIKDVFDLIVSNTREVTPTCTSLRYPVHLPISPNRPRSSRHHLAAWVCAAETVFWE